MMLGGDGKGCFKKKRRVFHEDLKIEIELHVVIDTWHIGDV